MRKKAIKRFISIIIAQRAFELVARNTVICGTHSAKCVFLFLKLGLNEYIELLKKII